MERGNFYDRLDAYVAIVQTRVDADYVVNYPNLKPPRFMVDPKGRRYVRIVQNDVSSAGRSVHSFVDKESGDILFPAGWKGPAKHARGNIWNDDGGADALWGHGSVKSLR